MRFRNYIVFVLLFAWGVNVEAQKDSIPTKEVSQLYQPKKVVYNPLSPSKAAFYSAVLPGAGQIYNNRYWWQLPLIYGGMASSVYFFIDNSNQYDRVRTAFRRRKAGLSDEFNTPELTLSDEALESAQRQFRQNRDLSLLTTVLIYVLQIVEASVTAHLLQFDDSDDLSLTPTTIPPNAFSVDNDTPKIGLTLKYSF